MMRLRLQVEKFIECDRLTTGDDLLIRMFQSARGIKAQDRLIIEADQFFGASAHGGGKGRVDIAIAPLKVLEHDIIGNRIVDPVKELALFFDLLRQPFEMLGHLAFLVTDQERPESAKGDPEDQHQKNRDTHLRLLLAAQMLPGDTIISFDNHPPVGADHRTAQGIGLPFPGQVGSHGKWQLFAAIKIKRRADILQLARHPWNNLLVSISDLLQQANPLPFFQQPAADQVLESFTHDLGQEQNCNRGLFQATGLWRENRQKGFQQEPLVRVPQ